MSLTEREILLLLSALEFYEETLVGDIGYLGEEDRDSMQKDIDIISDLYTRLINSKGISYS